jgi:hypothetical protein
MAASAFHLALLKLVMVWLHTDPVPRCSLG